MTRVTITNVGDRMDVHAAGCHDLGKAKYRPLFITSQWTIDAATQKEVVEDVYGPDAGSFYEEYGLDPADPTNWLHYRGEFHFYPCVNLPEE